MKIKILYDVYDIARRIRNIHRDYYIVFDTIDGKFEVHNSSQIDSTYCLTLPFPYLDNRVLQYVRETSVDNLDEILKNLDKENKIRESAILNSTLSSIEENMKGDE